MIFDSLIKPALDTVDHLINDFHLSPEQSVAAKQAIAEAAAKAQQASLDYEEAMAKISNDDRDSSRKREIAIRDFTPRMLAFGVTAGFFGILFYMALETVPAGSKDMLNIMLGSLGAAWVSIVSYYFGSSSDASRKTEILADQAKN